MIIKPKDMKTEEVPHLRGGDGTVIKTYMAPAQPDMHLRLLGRFTLHKGCSIGKHVHDGEVEYYCILAGQGIVTEDTGESTVNPGDVVVTGWGQSHSIRNDREDDLEFIAVINTEK